MIFSLSLVFIFCNLIFFIGFISLLFAIKSSFFVIVSVETMTIAVNLNFMFFSIFLNNDTGIIFNFFIIIMSACEVVVILTFFIYYFKKTNNLDINESILLLKH